MKSKCQTNLTTNINSKKSFKIKAFFKEMNFDEATRQTMFKNLSGLTLDMIQKVNKIVTECNLLLFRLLSPLLLG